MTNTPRIWVVKNIPEKSRKLVRAPSRLTAQKHVSAGTFATTLATQEDLAELLEKGAVIETVSSRVSTQTDTV